MNGPPRRRWFQFSLRTMFVVVTVFAVWLGWELKYVRERQAMVKRLGENRMKVIVAKADGTIMIPFWRRLLGDQPVAKIFVPKENAKVAQDAFPEAEVYFGVPADIGDWAATVFQRYVPE